MSGWVYLITNEAMPGLVKIGRTVKDPYVRAKELSHTGSPKKYHVEYAIERNDYVNFEKQLHKYFNEHRAGKEWFRVDLLEVVKYIESTVKPFGEEYESVLCPDELSLKLRNNKSVDEKVLKLSEEQEQCVKENREKVMQRRTKNKELELQAIGKLAYIKDYKKD